MEGGQSGEAVESITDTSSDFAFGADLFEESIATESSAVVEPAMEGVGAKIWSVIKSIFAKIAAFFKSLFNHSKQAAEKVEKQSKEAQKAFSKSDKVIVEEKGHSEKSESNAIVPASGSGTLGSTSSDDETDDNETHIERQKSSSINKNKDPKLDPAYDTGKVSAGHKYEKLTSNGNTRMVVRGNEKLGKALQNELDNLYRAIGRYVNSIISYIGMNDVKHATKICNRIQTVIKGNFSYKDKIYNVKDMRKFANAYSDEVQKNSKSKHFTDIEDDAYNLDRIVKEAEETCEGLKKFKAQIGEMWDKISQKFNADKYVIKVPKAGDPSKVATLDISAYVTFVGRMDMNYAKDLKIACDNLADISSKHIGFCEKMASIADSVNKSEYSSEEDRYQAQATFKLCKAYMKVSNVFATFSKYINEAITGSILRTSIT